MKSVVPTTDPVISLTDPGETGSNATANSYERLFGSLPDSLPKPSDWLLKNVGRKGPPRSARRSCGEWFLGTRAGQFCGMLLVGLLLIVCGAVVWTCVGPNREFDTSWWHAFCISYFFFIDPGTQTGISPEDPGRVLYTGIVFSLLGFLFNLILFGVLVEAVRQTLERWMRERGRIVLTGHTVVLGWTDKTLFLLRERLDAAENMGVHRMAVVVLAEKDEMAMLSDVKDYLPDKLRKHKIRCRQGRPGSPSDLFRVSVASACDVVVLGSSGSPHESDLEVMRIMVALGSMQDEISGKLIVEVRCPETVPKIEALLPNAGGIPARVVVNNLLCLITVQPSLGICATSLCSFQSGVELYAANVQALSGCCFSAAHHHFKRTICIGVMLSGSRLLLAPPDDHVISPGDTLIVLAWDASQIEVCEPQPFVSQSSLKRVAKMKKRMSSFLSPSGQAWPLRNEHPTARRSITQSGRGRGNILIIAGWPDDCGDLLQLLDIYVPSDTVVHILSDKPLSERQKTLSDRIPPTRIQIQHHVGDRTAVKVLAKLPLWEAHAVLVLSESEDFHAGTKTKITARQSDTECLACAISIIGLCEGRHGKEHAGELRGHIVCEVIDARTDRLLRRHTGLTSKCVFFRSNGLETGMFAMAVSDPIIFNVLTLLLTHNDVGNLVLEPIMSYLSDEDLASEHKDTETHIDVVAMLSFGELQQRVRGSQGTGGILIGWQACGADEPTLAPEADRQKLRPWAREDQLLLIRRPGCQ